MIKIINLLVKSKEDNQRADIFISKKESLLSRTRIKNLILKKKLKLNDKILTNPSKKVSVGDRLKSFMFWLSEDRGRYLKIQDLIPWVSFSKFIFPGLSNF